MNNLSSENGKQFLNDGRDDTCWSSAEGKFQYIFACFEFPAKIKSLEITCSGGFCPRVFLIIYFMKWKFTTAKKASFNPRSLS